ncbi:cytochrome P450 [Tanacetum coccineum]
MGADFPSHWSKEREPTTRINFNKNGEHTSRSNNIDEDGWTWVIETLKIPFNNETLSIRVIEVEGEIDNLFNGYVFASSSEYNSSDSDDGDDNLNQGDASHFGKDSDDHHVRVSKSFPFEDKNQNDSKHVVAENTGLIDSINGITGTRSQPLKKGWKKPSKQKINYQPITPTSVSNHDDILISDSLSKINRCNLRILSRPKPTTSSESIEVDKIVHLAYDYEFKKSDGKSGGIIAIWDTSCFSILASKEGDGFVAVKGTWLSLGCPCIFFVVCAPQCIRKKKVLWDNLNSILVENDCLSVIVGDFNEVCNPDERMGSLFCPRRANLFNNFISSSSLNDLPLGGMHFTRMNRSGTKLSKLDRILVSYHFMNQSPNAHVKTLIREFSDHASLLLCVASPDYGPVLFRFYNSWLLKEDFRSLLHNSWSCVLERPSSKAIIFKSKL